MSVLDGLRAAAPVASASGSGAAAPATAGFTTRQVHAGSAIDGDHGARVSPVHLSAGFVFDSYAEARDRFAGVDEGYLYTRNGNPTTDEVERRLAELEGGTEAILLASVHAATTTALLAILQAGDRILSSNSIYEGNRGLFRQNLGRLGNGVDIVDDHRDLDEWARRITPETRVLFGEPSRTPRTTCSTSPGSPTSPTATACRSWSTPRSRPRTCCGRSSTAPTSSCTRRASSSRATARCSAAWWWTEDPSTGPPVPTSSRT